MEISLIISWGLGPLEPADSGCLDDIDSSSHGGLGDQMHVLVDFRNSNERYLLPMTQPL